MGIGDPGSGIRRDQGFAGIGDPGRPETAARSTVLPSARLPCSDGRRAIVSVASAAGTERSN
jgi:hypothetical protein